MNPQYFTNSAFLCRFQIGISRQLLFILSMSAFKSAACCIVLQLIHCFHRGAAESSKRWLPNSLHLESIPLSTPPKTSILLNLPSPIQKKSIQLCKFVFRCAGFCRKIKHSDFPIDPNLSLFFSFQTELIRIVKIIEMFNTGRCRAMKAIWMCGKGNPWKYFCSRRISIHSCLTAQIGRLLTQISAQIRIFHQNVLPFNLWWIVNSSEYWEERPFILSLELSPALLSL